MADRERWEEIHDEILAGCMVSFRVDPDGSMTNGGFREDACQRIAEQEARIDLLVGHVLEIQRRLRLCQGDLEGRSLTYLSGAVQDAVDAIGEIKTGGTDG